MDWILDRRTECWSVLTTMKVYDYIALVRDAHANQGGIAGQRDVLKTTTAKRIRTRMVNDIRAGALLPPVVIGAVLTEDTFKSLPKAATTAVKDFLPTETGTLSIIDGMQRTGAMIEAIDIDKGVLEHPVRVEFWLAQSVRAMIYRMLVLNTGQVPWSLGRQLSVVYAPLLKEVEVNVTALDKVFTPNNPGRRRGPAQYSSDVLVELYLAFSLRKTNTEAKEALSEEFSRLDFVENVSEANFQNHFYHALALMSELDTAFSKYDMGASSRLSKGRNIFDSQPARIGFMAAVAQHALGRPGLDRDPKDRDVRMAEIVHDGAQLVARLAGGKAEEVGSFLALDILSDVLQKRVGQVGRYERTVYFDAFKVLVEEHFDLQTMEPCWRAS
jgi:hypothetical protein